MKFKKVFLIGEGKVAKVCQKIGEDFLGQEVQKIENKNRTELDTFFNNIKNSLIISANNSYLFKKPCVANNTIINYHNSLLPKHKGLNAHIWAIWENDEKTGITWHKVDENIDTGAIILQKEIMLDESFTALKLLRYQHDLAINSFKECLEKLILSQFTFQENGGGYHSKSLPNEGFLELFWEKEKICRFLRAMQSDNKKPRLKLLNQELEVLFYEMNSTKLSFKLSENINLEITKE